MTALNHPILAYKLPLFFIGSGLLVAATKIIVSYVSTPDSRFDAIHATLGVDEAIDPDVQEMRPRTVITDTDPGIANAWQEI